MEILAQEFLSKLRNFEKQRNRNLFQNYSLDFLEKVFQKLGLESSSQSIRVSVVGTNGKGSTAFFLSELILKNQLGTVGLYTSPHLLTERERIQMNGNYFEYEDLNSFLQNQDPEIFKDLSQLSYFEFLTLFAMFQFRKQNCNFEIYEAGLGGRLDATKLAKANYVVVTKIGIDHAEILGDTREKILQEKLGIITEKCKALFYFPQDEEILDKKIENFCMERKILVYKFQDTFENYVDFNLRYAKFILETITSSEIANLNISNMPGRMEIISENPLILFDVGHNPDAVQSLITSIDTRFTQVKWNVLVGCLPDKDIKSILEILTTWKNCTDVFLLTNAPFTKPHFPHKAREIASLNFKWSGALLVVGSFRLYEILPELKKLFKI